MKRSRRILRFVAIQALVLFVIAEVGLRILRPVNQNLQVLLYLPSISTGFDSVDSLPDLLEKTIIGFKPYTPIAGFVRNSRGLRTHEYTRTKPEGTLRIVLIGDSFSFSCAGIPYSDAWHVRLEQLLDAARPDRVEVLTLGVPGVGPLFERRMWQIEGSRLNADVLLLQLYVGNDFTDHNDVRLEGGAATVLARWSYVVRIVRNLGRVVAARDGGDPEAARISVEPGAGGARGGYELPEYRAAFADRKPFMTAERLGRVESGQARLCEASQSEEFEELLERMETVLRDLRDEVEAAGVLFRVVVIPDRFQVNPEDREDVLARLGMPESLFDWDKPQRALDAFFEREGIEYLDLLPVSREASAREQLYDVGNTHWNVRGNAFAAERIAEWLTPDLPPPGS